jgi:hypothetical protein
MLLLVGDFRAVLIYSRPRIPVFVETASQHVLLRSAAEQLASRDYRTTSAEEQCIEQICVKTSG